MNDEREARRMLVVGASSGIGAAVATLAASRGWHVALTARRLDRLEEIAAGCPDAHPIAGDVRVEDDVRRVVDEAVRVLGGVDAVVYATGVSPLLPMADATQDDWRSVFDTNVIGAALVSAAVAPHLIASGGRLVVLSSKAVRRPFPDLALYSTSKITLDGLIRCLPLEFPGLHVTRLVVGNTAGTEFASSWDSDALEAAVGRWSASGVLGSVEPIRPEDVAETIIHTLDSRAHLDDVAVLDHEPQES